MQEIFQQPKNEMLISVITEAELLSTPTVCEDAGLKAGIIEFINDSDYVIEVNRNIAQTAGEIRSSLHYEFGRKIKLPDALIASSAIHFDAILVSNNDRDFKDISLKYNMKYYNPVSNQQALTDFLSNN